jgi:hypothetical protein
MGYVALHLSKASGNDAGTSAHIERTIRPKNADENRTHLNAELIEFPSGVHNRTEAIQHRIDCAGIKRKITSNQVRAIRVMLSGTHEDMKRIEAEGCLDGWCRDNVDWLKQTFGADNVVSAVLHMDEKTPHIHATVVPIVTGERRKAKTKKPEPGRKQYKKKNPNAARLCADDIMARDKLKAYQSDYAERMSAYGLSRGVDGSEARHITTQEYYRELYVANEQLKEDIHEREQQKQEVYEQVRDIYNQRDEARDKFLAMDGHVQAKEMELAKAEGKLRWAQKAYEPYKAQDELNRIHELFPEMKEKLRIADLCQAIGFTVQYVKHLLSGGALNLPASYKLYSPEHKRHFLAGDGDKVRIERVKSDEYKLRLSLNGSDILDWFRQKWQTLQQSFRFHRPEPERRREIRW